MYLSFDRKYSDPLENRTYRIANFPEMPSVRQMTLILDPSTIRVNSRNISKPYIVAYMHQRLRIAIILFGTIFWRLG